MNKMQDTTENSEQITGLRVRCGIKYRLYAVVENAGEHNGRWMMSTASFLLRRIHGARIAKTYWVEMA